MTFRETITAVEYDNGDAGGWHVGECIKHRVETGFPLCGKED